MTICRVLLVSGLLLGFACAQIQAAQRVTITVVDETGVAVPDARVALTPSDGSQSLRCQTSPAGMCLSAPGAYFLLDGQPFSSSQVVQWAVGSTHQIYFVQSQEPNGTLSNHQYPTIIPGTRFTFSAWNITGETADGSQPLLTITVAPTLTQILGQVDTEVQLYIYFNGFTDPNLPCSATAVSNDPREGIMLVGSTCYSSPTTIWITPGPKLLRPRPSRDTSSPIG